MSYPSDLKYTKDHEWIKITGNTALIGITAYALEQLSDVVHMDLPEKGTAYKEGETFGTVESTKTVSDLYMPVEGKVVDVNTNLLKNLEEMQSDPYGKGWLVKVEITKQDGKLLSAADYEKYLADQE